MRGLLGSNKKGKNGNDSQARSTGGNNASSNASNSSNSRDARNTGGRPKHKSPSSPVVGLLGLRKKRGDDGGNNNNNTSHAGPLNGRRRHGSNHSAGDIGVGPGINSLTTLSSQVSDDSSRKPEPSSLPPERPPFFPGYVSSSNTGEKPSYEGSYSTIESIHNEERPIGGIFVTMERKEEEEEEKIPYYHHHSPPEERRPVEEAEREGEGHCSFVDNLRNEEQKVESLEEELMISFVASFHFLHQYRLDVLTPQDYDMIVRFGKSRMDPNRNEEKRHEKFNAVSQLNELFDKEPRFVQLRGDGRFVFNREELLRDLSEFVSEANCNGQTKFALFCITPQQHVFLAIYHRGGWYAWQSHKGRLEHKWNPNEMVDGWLKQAAVEEGFIVKSVILLPSSEDNTDNHEEEKTEIQEIENHNQKALAVPVVQEIMSPADPPAYKKGEEESTTFSTKDTIDVKEKWRSQPETAVLPSFQNISPVASHQRASSSGSAFETDRFRCPISKDLMADPVSASDGKSYDRPSIEKHFQTSNRSPWTNQVISKTLYANMDLRNVIETHVEMEAESGNIDPEELADYRRRRMERIENDRLRNYSLQEKHTDAPAPTENENYTFLCQMVRVDDTDDDLFGDDNFCVSVVFGDESSRPAFIPNLCSVGCCISRLSTDSRSCLRCRRPTCSKCLVMKAADIRFGNTYKQNIICLECAWQIADAMTRTSQDNERTKRARESILQRKVACRLVDIHKDVLAAQYQRFLSEVVAESPISELLELENQARNTRKKFEQALNRLLANTEGQNGSDSPIVDTQTSGETPVPESSLDLFGSYPDNQNLPLGLTFPTSSMRLFVENLRSRLDEAKPVLRGWAYTSTLHEVRNRSLSSVNSTVNISRDMTIEEMIAFPDASSIARDLLSQVSADDQTNNRTPIPLRMCGMCACGPFERLPTGGCPNCSWNETDFSGWPAWDGVMFGERHLTRI